MVAEWSCGFTTRGSLRCATPAEARKGCVPSLVKIERVRVVVRLRTQPFLELGDLCSLQGSATGSGHRLMRQHLSFWAWIVDQTVEGVDGLKGVVLGVVDQDRQG